MSSLFNINRIMAERKEEEAQSDFFPGRDGIPFRGHNISMMREEELQKLLVYTDVRAGIFCINEEKERLAYEDIRTRGATFNGEYVILHKEWHWNHESARMYVYLEWGRRYRQEPPKTVPGDLDQPAASATFRPKATENW